MRYWRKVYGSVVESDRLAGVSDSAALLFVFLLTKQDDAGQYPNTQARLRALSITRHWTDEVLTTYLRELDGVGLVTLDKASGHLTIRRGQELNGIPKDGSEGHRKPRYYPRTDLVSTTSVPRTTREEIRLDEIRRDEIRRDGEVSTSPSAAKRSQRSRGKSMIALEITQRPTWTYRVEGVGPVLFSSVDDWERWRTKCEALIAAIDVDAEVLKFAAWWSTEGCKNARSAWLNWLEKATTPKEQRNGTNQHGPNISAAVGPSAASLAAAERSRLVQARLRGQPALAAGERREAQQPGGGDAAP